LSYNQLYGEVMGMNNLQAEYEAIYGPGSYIPPAVFVYWSFRIMVGAGILMVILAFYALFLVMGEMLENRQRGLKVLVLAMALPYLANSAGWILTEVGRYPWTVYGLYKLDESVSLIVTSGMVWVSLIGYTLVYSALIVATVYLFQKYAKAGPEPIDKVTSLSDDIPSLVAAQD
ncbi:MAG: cytochrome ubiquinol oxidase subunit I, partial [Anaerolineales bacterium]|nr:cytochrome ubiquinol oxidase subunit I [Anaerolineales bacterium]